MDDIIFGSFIYFFLSSLRDYLARIEKLPVVGVWDWGPFGVEWRRGEIDPAVKSSIEKWIKPLGWMEIVTIYIQW